MLILSIQLLLQLFKQIDKNMLILVLNSGSSSIKYKLFLDLKEVLSGVEEEVIDFEAAFENIFIKLIQSNYITDMNDIDAFGHRVVHGGEKFTKPTLVSDEVCEHIKQLYPLAPLHNPSNLKGILAIKKSLPLKSQVVVFDTAFHQTIKKENFLYPIPIDYYENYHIRKYGFHGTSHYYVVKQFATYINKPLEKLNLISLHLGNGASITAIKNGISIDTSMGFTPLEGLMMGTRCGDIDPSIIFYMQRVLGLNINTIDDILNKQSGLKGICGFSDIRKILNLKDEKSKLAINMFTSRIKKYIGSYSALLGRVDGIIFTGGIGEHSSFIRTEICKSLEIIGVKIDKIKNETNKEQLKDIGTHDSKIKIVVIPTNEELEIAISVTNLI